MVIDKKRNDLIKAIDFAINTDNRLYFKEEENNNKIKQADKICVFGTGEFFKGYNHFFKHIDFICDNNPEKWGKVICGFKCVSPEELYKEKNVAVIIMVSKYREIKKQLDNNNILNFYFGDLYFNVYSDYHNGKWFESERENILKVYDLLADEKSKYIYKEAVCLRIAPHIAESIFGELETTNEYFNKEIFSFSDKEILVDAGAYNGDSILKFIEAVDNKFDKIYGFELEKQNYLDMKENLKEFDLNKIELFNYGTSDKKEIISCDGNGVNVRISDEGEKATLVSIDEIINSPITFIKMDVEGAEQKSLQGAKNLIKKYKPKMCISAYHKLEDLWQIPLQIISFNSDYKLFMRHHSPLAWDTDCYAKLKEAN